MAKKLQLQIPTPCHENWEDMRPVEKGRFCSSCQKKVVDFSNMSDGEIAVFFKNSLTGSVCGRFADDQLNRDIEIPGKRIPWLKYLFQFSLPTFLFSCDPPNPHGNKKIERAEKTAFVENSYKEIKRKVTQVTVGMLLPEIVHNTNPSHFHFKKNHNKLRTPSMMLPDVKLPKLTDKDSFINTSIHNPIPSQQQLSGMAGAVSVRIGGVATECRIKKSSKATAIFSRLFDTIVRNFEIYPNPIQSNSTLSIEWKQKEYGDYVLQLFNQSGQLIYSKQMYVGPEARKLAINMPLVPPGNYFFRITSKTMGKSFSEKLIVQ